MSQKTEIYANYLKRFNEQHPNVVQPTIFGVTTPIAEVEAARAEAQRDGKLVTYGSKVFEHSTPVGTYQMPDGRVIEVAQTNYGSPLVAIHATTENYANYAQPMSINMYWNG